MLGRDETSVVLSWVLGEDLHKASSLYFFTFLLVFSVRPSLICVQSLSRVKFFDTHGLWPARLPWGPRVTKSWMQLRD